MIDKITLILILHNRHKNLDRLLEYYNDCTFPIIIADSSKKKHEFDKTKSNWIYSYTPDLSFTEKIEVTLQKVTTPYVTLCADDDFIFPKSLDECALFLDQNPIYSIVQGWAIRYYKETIISKSIRFGLLYKSSKSIEDENPLDRLRKMFINYRSILYATFRTEVLQNAFAGAGKAVKNLFLNEYITAYLPILSGKYKELPLLYQVREYAFDSDDKTAIDLDTIMENAEFEEELNKFTNFISKKASSIVNIKEEKVKELIKHIQQLFSAQLKVNRQERIPLKKKIGKLVSLVPFFGKKIIFKNREKKSIKQLQPFIKTQYDKNEITRISHLLTNSE